MRLFLGLEVPQTIKNQINDYLFPFRESSKGWENPSDYHLTLLFFGETLEEKIDEIKQRMEKITSPPVQVHLVSPDFFNRRIMYIRVHPSTDLIELKFQVDNQFSEWLRPGEKPYIPHITVKRWQRYEYPKLTSSLQDHPFEARSFEASALCLFKSEKDEKNIKYHIIHRHPLLVF